MATNRERQGMSFGSMIWRFIYLLVSYFLLAYITTISDELFIPFTIFIGGIMYDYYSLGVNARNNEGLKAIATKGLKYSAPFIIIGALGITKVLCIKKLEIWGISTPIITTHSICSIPIPDYIGIPYLFIWLVGWIVPGIEIRSLWKSLLKTNIFDSTIDASA
jgi:hypothetical protein